MNVKKFEVMSSRPGAKGPILPVTTVSVVRAEVDGEPCLQFNLGNGWQLTVSRGWVYLAGAHESLTEPVDIHLAAEFHFKPNRLFGAYERRREPHFLSGCRRSLKMDDSVHDLPWPLPRGAMFVVERVVNADPPFHVRSSNVTVSGGIGTCDSITSW